MGPGRPEAGAPGGRRLPRSARVRLRRDIQNLLRRGKRTRTRHLDVFVIASPVSRPRFGTVVPKHRHRIVERNRLRRRLREVGRTRVLPRLWEAGRDLDVLVRARREAYEASYQELEADLKTLTETLCSSGSS
jgi:ribonuclease P protein component